MTLEGGPALAVLTSRYPAVSHSFILREVRSMRALGYRVETFTVRRVAREELLSADDQAEDASTFALLPTSGRRLTQAHMRAVLRAPWRYAATLALAIRRGGSSPRDMLWQVFYFVEAMLLWHRLSYRGIRHVHAHFANVSSDVALLVSAFDADLTWTFTMHGPTELYDVAAHRLAEKVRRADGVICISDFARSQLMGMVEPEHWEKLRVVHCGIDTTTFRRGDRPPSPRPFQVLTVARLASVKGHEILLEAAALLLERGVPFGARLVGGGPERARLERLAAELGVADVVDFFGPVGQDRIAELYADADVFCLPSFAEGVPIVLMEAMACEIPVVTTRIMGIPELVQDGLHGLLVTPGRADQVADALERLAADPAERARMGAEGRRRVEAEFETSACARALAAELASLPAVL